MADYLLYASERYALPILQPLAAALHAAGHRAHALLVRGAAGAALPAPTRAVDVRGAVALKPRAVFSAANDVPTFVSGAKVQLHLTLFYEPRFFMLFFLSQTSPTPTLLTPYTTLI